MTKLSLSDGAQLHVETHGAGRHVLFVTGLGGTAAVWNSLITEMGSDLRAITFDQRGIGQSSRGCGPVTTATLATDCWHILDEIGEGRPILVGHSTGGAIIQAMERIRPGAAAGLVLSASWAGPNRYMAALFQNRLQLLEHSGEAYAANATFLAYPAGWLHTNWQKFERAIENAPRSPDAQEVVRERIGALLAHDMRDDLPSMDAPALILSAADDQIVPSFLQDELLDLLPNAEMHRFEHGGHGFTETRPDAVAEQLTRWIQTLKS